MRTSVILILFFLSVFPLMAETISTEQTKNYEQLLAELRSLKKSDFETPRERVHRNWKAGVLMNAFIRNRAPNAEIHELLVKLERDLGKGQRYFADVRDFARDYPAGPPDVDLPWTYFTITASMADPAQREALLRQALAERWDTRRLDREAWRIRFGTEKEELPELEAHLGRPGIYRILNHNQHLSLDLGFDTYLALSPEEAQKFKEGDIVQCGVRDPGYRIHDAGDSKNPESCILHPESVPSDFFIRRAKILKILDGDTLLANLDLGFGIETQKKMRLRGVDAPELDTDEGLAAKAYLEKLLASGEIFIRAEKMDKYNRPLADVWLDKIYVNRKMLDEGQAARMDE